MKNKLRNLSDGNKFWFALYLSTAQVIIGIFIDNPLALFIHCVAMFLSLQAVAYYNGKDTAQYEAHRERTKGKLEAYREILFHFKRSYGKEDNEKMAKIINFVKKNT